MKVLYATDMDRTIIYSQRFMDEYPPESNYEVAETKGNRIISYISSPVKKRINELSRNNNIELIPVTTRSIEEFNRINIGINNKYSIVSNGGIILEDGKPMKEWEDYINKTNFRFGLMQASMDLGELQSVVRDVTIIDGRYLFTKTDCEEQFDIEIQDLIYRYPNIVFTRQRKKIYAIPNNFSKAIALRWLQNKLGIDTLVASGDSELDLPMLAIADYAIIPKHGDLIKEGFVTDGRVADAGIDSPMYTMDIVENLIK